MRKVIAVSSALILPVLFFASVVPKDRAVTGDLMGGLAIGLWVAGCIVATVVSVWLMHKGGAARDDLFVAGIFGVAIGVVPALLIFAFLWIADGFINKTNRGGR